MEDNPAGFVRIAIHNEATRLLFQVENSFDPDNLQKDAVGGVGLENIRQRLELNHRGRYRFETSRSGQVFIATLELAHD